MKKIILFSAFGILFFTGLIRPPTTHARLAPENGVQTETHPNGQLKSEETYKNGQIVRRRYFYENGRLQIEYLYRNGQLIRAKSFYENGKIKSVRDIRKGYVKHYDEEGRLEETLDLQNRHLKKFPSSFISSY